MPVRVISGSAGGLFLKTPKGGFVRPTMDRVKSALFSIIGPRIEGAAVLDLYAGTGGLGIEALSRGAGSVVFVDSDARAVAAVEENLTRTGLSGPSARVVRADAIRYVQRGAGASGPFDIIFADPPYAQKPGDFDPGLALAHDPALRGILAPGGLFVLERRTGEENIPVPAGLAIRDVRAYGRTTLLFLSHDSP